MCKQRHEDFIKSMCQISSKAGGEAGSPAHCNVHWGRKMEPAPCTHLKENVLQPHPKSVCVRFSVFLLGTKFLWASLSFFWVSTGKLFCSYKALWSLARTHYFFFFCCLWITVFNNNNMNSQFVQSILWGLNISVWVLPAWKSYPRYF